MSSKFSYFYFILLLFSLLSFPLSSQETKKEENEPEGKSTEALKLPEEIKIRPFVYEPINLAYWERVKQLLELENYVELVAMGNESMNTYEVGSPEYAEGQLVLGIGLYHLKFSYAATLQFMPLALERIGSQIGIAALDYLDKIVQEYPTDQIDLREELLNSSEFGQLPDTVASFVAYHRTLYTSAYGFKKWTEVEIKKIHPLSYWNYKYQYLIATSEVARNRIESALAIYRQLAEAPETPDDIRNDAKLQVARLIFEQSQFEPALEIYRSLSPSVRERGRILLERAWIHYYLRDFSKSLGQLRALEAPYFAPSIHPERYILEMIIYKQLCHYEAVDDAVKRFTQRFGAALSAIRNRKDLTKEATLLSMALMNQDIQGQANFVDMLRKEMETLLTYDWDDLSFYEEAMDRYELKDKQVRSRLNRNLQRITLEIAEEILDYKEQVDFIDYSSRLDSLRIVRKGENRDYRSESISFLTFDKIFWTVEEYWWDELDDYTVLISSRCGVNQDTSDAEPEGDF